MSRLFLVILTLLADLTAGERLSNEQMSRLNRYNHRASVGSYDQNVLQSFAKISGEKAKAVSKRECGDVAVESVRLKRKGHTLYYEVRTVKGRSKINALDGSVIRCAGERQ